MTASLGLSGLSPVTATATQAETTAGVLIAPSGFATASSTLTNAQLTVQLSGASAGDTLLLQSGGKVTLSGATVRVGGIAVGAASGGVGGSVLVVKFNAGVSSAQVSAVLDAVALHNVSPPTAGRTVSFTLSAAGAITATASSVLTLTAAAPSAPSPAPPPAPTPTPAPAPPPPSSGPVLSGFGPVSAAVTNAQAAAGVALASAASLSSASGQLAGGALIVHLAGSTSSDTLELAATQGVSVSGSSILVNGVRVGTFSGGQAGTDLQISFSAAQVTTAQASAVLEAVSLANSASSPPAGARALSFTASDASGHSATQSTTVTLQHLASPPVFVGLPSATQTITLASLTSTAGVQLAGSATVSNPDGSGFSGGKLTVHLTGGSTADTLALVSSGLLSVSGSTVSYNGKAIGTVSGGARGADLVVTLSASGATTDTVATAILQAVRLHATAAPSPTLTASFTYTDHDGDSSVASVAYSTDQAPTAVSVTGLVSAINEHVAVGAGIEVGTIAITDDGQGVNTVSLFGADAADFAVRTDAKGHIGLYYTGASPNYATQSAYNVIVSVQDKALTGSQPATTAYTLNVAAVHTAPTSVQFSDVTSSIPEHSAVGAGGVEVAVLGVSGDDLANVAFTLSGPDAAVFSVHSDAQNHEALFYTGASPIYAAQSVYSVTVSAADPQVTGAAPASSPFTLGVTQVNEAPTAVVATPLITTLAEDTAIGAGIEVAVVSVADDGLGVNTLSLSGADAASFSLRIDPEGREGLYYVGASPDYHVQSSYAVTVTAADSSLPSSTPVNDAYTLSISAVDHAPTSVQLTPLVSSLGEGTTVGAGIEVATVQVTDDGLGTNTYAVTGADAVDFVVQPDSSGQMALFYVGASPSLAIQAAYHVTVQVQDLGLPSSTPVSQSYTLSVTPVNHAPTAVQLTTEVSSLADGTSVGSGIEVAQISVVDDGLGTNTLSLSGVDKADFAIETDGSKHAALFFTGPSPSYLTQASYSVSVNAQDTAVLGSSPVSQVFNLAVTPVNHAPTGVSFQNTTTTVAQGTAIGTGLPVATIIIADPDNQYGTDTVSLSGANASDFTLGAGPSNHQDLYYVGPTTSAASYSVTVGVQDSTIANSTAVTSTFTFGVTQSDQPPTAVNLSATTATMAENTSIGTGILMSNVSVTDDGLGTNSYALVGADASSFTLEDNGGQEQLFFTGASPNYEAKSSYSVTVKAYDAALPQSTPVYKTFTLNITNVNEAPSVVATTSSFTVTGTQAVPLSGVQVSDPEGDSQTAVLTVQHGVLSLPAASGVTGTGTGASLTLSGTQTALNQALAHLQYLPTTGYTGSDTVAITSTDVHGLQGATTDLTVTVQPGPLLPLQGSQFYDPAQASSSASGSLFVGASAGETITGLNEGSTQATVAGSGSSTSYTVTGAYGTLVVGHDGTYTYTSTAALNGSAIDAVSGSHPSETFSFTAQAGSSTQTDTLTIDIDRLPSVGTVTAQVAENGAVITAGAAPGLLSSATDADGDGLALASVAHGATSATLSAQGADITGSYGALHVNADGSYSYTPDTTNTQVSGLTNGQSLTDAFTYTLNDGQGGQNSATLDIDVNGPGPFAINHTDPVAGYSKTVSGDLFTENAASNPGGAIKVSGVQAQSVGAGGTTVTDSIGGSLHINPDGSYTYTTPASLHFDGEQGETFSYIVSDSAGHTATANLIFDVTNPIYVAQSEVLNGATASGSFQIDASTGTAAPYTVSVTASDTKNLSSSTLLSWLSLTSGGSTVDATHPLVNSHATVTESFSGDGTHDVGDVVSYQIAIADPAGDVAYHTLVITI